jgi:epsilon-lactone hydrolase
MPSFRAQAANLVLRSSVKPSFRRGHSVASVRRLATRFDRVASRPPRGTRSTRVELDGFSAERISVNGSRGAPVLLYLPGGGFVVRTPAAHRALVARICQEARADALLTFYRLAPEHPFPAALHDCVTAYEYVLGEGVSESAIVIGGDSAGGCLALATLMALRDRGTALPAAGFTLSAVTDLRPHTNGSRTTNARRDSMLSIEGSAEWHRYYVGDDLARLNDPLVSPVLGDFGGLPPLLMQASTTEILLDDTRLVARRAIDAGVDCSLELFAGLSHVWQMLPRLPESRRALRDIGTFIRRHAATDHKET